MALLPQYAAFKGDNGKYLRVITPDGVTPYLQFSADNNDHVTSRFETTQLQPTGNYKVMSSSTKHYWHPNTNGLIVADSKDSGKSDEATFFFVEKVGEKTYAILNKGNNMYCQRFTDDYVKDYLKAAAPTHSMPEARFFVEDIGGDSARPSRT